MRVWRMAVAGLVVAGVLAGALVALLPRQDTEASALSRPVDAQPMTVVEVLSGDSVMLTAELPGSQVTDRGLIAARVLNVDAPNYGIVPECFSVEAKARLEELLPRGSIAWVATEATPRDDADRWMFNIWTADGRLVSYLLAVDGFVRAREMAPNTELLGVVQRAEASAAARFGGLWGECR